MWSWIWLSLETRLPERHHHTANWCRTSGWRGTTAAFRSFAKEKRSWEALVVRFHDLSVLSHQETANLLHIHCFPAGQVGMRIQIFQRNRVCPYDNRNMVLELNELLELGDVWARRKPNHKPCCKMDHFRPIPDHLFRYIFNIPTWATTAI